MCRQLYKVHASDNKIYYFISSCKMASLTFLFTFSALFLGGSFAANFPNFRVRYSRDDISKGTSFFAMPRTETEATEGNWTLVQQAEYTTLYCYMDDYRTCPLYDKKGSICGYQLAVTTAVDDLQMPGINFTAMGYEKKKVLDRECYATQIFFVPQETIVSGGRDFDNQTGYGLWVPVGHEELLNIPVRNNQTALEGLGFVLQNCFPRMGVHYFYKAQKTTEPSEYRPFFVLYSKAGDLVGTGMVIFGRNADNGTYARDMFEDITRLAISLISPGSPKWVLDYADQYGIFGHHVYLIDEPWEISC